MATKVTAKTSTTVPNKVHWSFWLGVTFFAVVILTLCAMAWALVDRVSAQESAPVTTLSIMGEMPYTTRQDIENAIENVNLGNFFQLDVNEVQAKVLDLPWVYSVSVRKQWPSELKIYVVDQQPVAYWNGDFLLNEKGNAFQAQQGRITKTIPAFFGPEGSEKVALENFQNLNKLLGYADLAIDELVLTERYSWQLTLNDGVMLNLGREDRVKRIQRFLDVYSQIKNTSEEQKQIDYVDLRYDTGLAVGWKDKHEKERV